MSMPRHILFINEFFHPDVCASAMVAADHLPRMAKLLPNCRFTALAGNRAWDDSSLIYEANDEFQGVKIVRVQRPLLRRANLFSRAWGFAAFGRNAVRAADTLGKVDLVIATTAPPQGGAIARKIARRDGCPYIYTVLDLYPDLAATLGRIAEGSLTYRWWWRRDAKLMHEAAAVVSIADEITQRIARTRGIDPAKLATIHDGFDPERIRVAGENRFRRETNPDGKFVVQYAGNMGLSHPFETIMGACTSLSSETGILFQFIGDGPQLAYIKSHCGSNGYVFDYQPADRLGEVLATADACLISQHDDMFDKALPYKMYGILAAGKPAIFIGNERSEIVGWLKKSGAGMHVNQGDVEGLDRAIRSLKSDPALAKSMGAAGRQLFEREFHVQRASEKWADLIQRILK